MEMAVGLPPHPTHRLGKEKIEPDENRAQGAPLQWGCDGGEVLQERRLWRKSLAERAIG